MHALRRSVHLTRLILAWFVLAVGIAAAAPVVAPQAMELVCSAGGEMRLVAIGDDEGGGAAPAHHSLDCPLCLATAVPLPQASAGCVPVQPLAHALQPIAAAHIAALVGAPLPPRGPPALS